MGQQLIPLTLKEAYEKEQKLGAPLKPGETNEAAFKAFRESKKQYGIDESTNDENDFPVL